MADGSISFSEGLGCKAQDSNELRRKQKHSSQKIHLSQSLTRLDAQSSPSGFGPHSPNSANSSSPSRKLQQVFQTEGRRLESEARLLGIVGHLEDELNNSEDPFVLDIVTAKLQSIQQSWRKAEEQELLKVAEERNSGLMISGGQENKNRDSTGPINSSGFDLGYISTSPDSALKLKQVLSEGGSSRDAGGTPSQVHNPKTKVRLNASGKPYALGDPNLGYSIKDTTPRYAASTQILAPTVPNLVYHASTSTNPVSQPKVRNRSVQPNKNWASLFRSQGPSSNMKFDFFPEFKKGKDAVVELDITHLDENCWSHCLVGHFLDGRMDFRLANSTAHKLWGKTTKFGLISVKSDNAGFLYLEFKDEDCQRAVLEGGPWFFSQKFLVLKKWRRMMTPSKISPSSIPTWVKLHNLPPECWTEEGLSRVASAIGQPKHVDQATEKRTRLAYARVCVEIEAADELPDHIEVTVDGESVSVRVEYQLMPPVCSECGVFGHATSRCPRAIPHKQTQDSGLPKKEWQTVIKGSSLSNLGGSAALDAVTTPVMVEVVTSIPKVTKEAIDDGDSEGEELDVNTDIASEVKVDSGVIIGSVEADLHGLNKGNSGRNIRGSEALDAGTIPVVNVEVSSMTNGTEGAIMESELEGEELNVNPEIPLEVKMAAEPIYSTVVPIVKPVPPDDTAEAGQSAFQNPRDLKSHNTKGSGKSSGGSGKSSGGKKWSSSSKKRHK